MKIETKTNGYEAKTIQAMIKNFETAAARLFPECLIRHFYYGDYTDMADIVLDSKGYAHFNVTANRVSLCGYSCTGEDLKKFESMTYNDECYNGRLMKLIKT